MIRKTPAFKIDSPTIRHSPLPTETDTPRRKFRARFISSIEQLNALQPQWQRLMDTSIHRNLMFDPDFLIPAMEHLADENVKVLVIDAPQKAHPRQPPVLCALVPLQKKRIYGMPLRSLEIWRHDQCFDTTPLLRADCANEVLGFMLDFLAEEAGVSLLGIDTASNEGRFAQVLTDVLKQRNTRCFFRDSFARAGFTPEADTDTYLDRHVSKGVQKNNRRMQRRLADQGELTYHCNREQRDAAELIEHFLRLEASGWKGSQGTALECDQKKKRFFQKMVTRSMANGKLSFLSVNLAGRPISMLCDLYSDAQGYAFKTAFDDGYKAYSPGLMAEIRNIEYMHDARVQRMDSCTAPNNPTMDRIWGQRLRFQSLVIPLGGRMSRWAVAAMPLLQQIRHSLSNFK